MRFGIWLKTIGISGEVSAVEDAPAVVVAEHVSVAALHLCTGESLLGLQLIVQSVAVLGGLPSVLSVKTRVCSLASRSRPTAHASRHATPSARVC